MSEDEIAALADCVGIFLDDIRRSRAAGPGTPGGDVGDDAGQPHMSADITLLGGNDAGQAQPDRAGGATQPAVERSA